MFTMFTAFIDKKSIFQVEYNCFYPGEYCKTRNKVDNSIRYKMFWISKLFNPVSGILNDGIGAAQAAHKVLT
jgi:hypothetical protein